LTLCCRDVLKGRATHECGCCDQVERYEWRKNPKWKLFEANLRFECFCDFGYSTSFFPTSTTQEPIHTLAYINTQYIQCFPSISSLLLSHTPTTIYKKAASPTIPITTPVKPSTATTSAAPVNCAGRDEVAVAVAERVALPPVAIGATVVPADARLDTDAAIDDAAEAADEARLDAAEDADAATDEA
jgi:hypothetical protein